MGTSPAIWRTGLLAIIVALVVALTSSDLFAAGEEEAQRIEFAPGTDRATVEGTFHEGVSDRWVLRAAAGQTMTVSLSPPGTGASLGVFAPDGSQLPGGPGDEVTYRLPAAGDYVIVVGGGRGDSSPTYSMTVTIPAQPRRVEFAAGTDRATLSGSFSDSLTDTYVLRAVAGQTMTFEPVGSLGLGVTAPDGSPLPFAPDSAIAFSLLPLTGDYVVTVTPKMSNATTYAMTVTIVDGTGEGIASRRVEFPSGSFGTTLTDSVEPGVTHRFVLGAGERQTLDVQITAGAPGSVVHSIVAANGDLLVVDEEQSSVRLPSNGDYFVDVRATGATATYDISFRIE